MPAKPASTNVSNGDHDRPERGLTRRALFRTGGGGAAAAVIVGLGTTPAAAQSGREGTSRPGEGRLVAVDPHDVTGRTKPAPAQGEGPHLRILPIDRAKFLAGTSFDLRVEATGVDPESARIEIALTGPDGRPAELLREEPERSSSADDSLEVTFRGLSYERPGGYEVHATVTSGEQQAEATVSHEVVTSDVEGRKAKNVIFFLGDGMGQPAITAARILSKGIAEGKYHGRLEMDGMEFRGIVGTSGIDSIATDSANSMSAYMTGHKSAVNALGVYPGISEDPADHPWVENIAELLKRTRDMAIGVVTTAEIQDATPAAVWAHTRRRAEYVDIMDQALEPDQRPDVLLGGGMASLLPQSEPDSRRGDDRDLRKEFQAEGYAYASTRKELRRATRRATQGRGAGKLLGTFHPGNMNVYLDREHIKQPDVLGRWDDQPTLMEMTSAALEVLERNDDGFFLMVEAASIDKMEHPLDGPRVAYETIEFDQAIGVAKQWAEGRDDTLIVITADHNHSMSIVGTHDRREREGRAANGVYADAGFPTYVDSNGNGFPDDPNPEVGLFFGWSNHPDHTDDFQHNDVFLQPAMQDEDGVAVDNPERDPDAELQIGNLPPNQTNCVHTVEDVPIFASGAGAARFNDFLDNTEVFFAMMDALGLEV